MVKTPSQLQPSQYPFQISSVFFFHEISPPTSMVELNFSLVKMSDDAQRFDDSGMCQFVSVSSNGQKVESQHHGGGDEGVIVPSMKVGVYGSKFVAPVPKKSTIPP